jgi:hypothetical protein
MPFTDIEIQELEALFVAGRDDAQTVADYRRRFPGRTLTRCEESDMGPEEPFRQWAALNLYLVDGRNHCWRITRDPGTATGVVLARLGPPA